MKLRCFYCHGQFGLTRRRLNGKVFCSAHCEAWHCHEIEEEIARKKAVHTLFKAS